VPAVSGIHGRAIGKKRQAGNAGMTVALSTTKAQCPCVRGVGIIAAIGIIVTTVDSLPPRAQVPKAPARPTAPRRSIRADLTKRI
jgi:hypothetical protein